jgi:hypothetical protein
MDYLYEKIAYLNGLIDGMEMDETTKEGKAISAIADILEDIIETIDDMDEEQAEMEEYVELMDDDLSIIEEEVFGEFDIEELEEEIEEVELDEE